MSNFICNNLMPFFWVNQSMSLYKVSPIFKANSLLFKTIKYRGYTCLQNYQRIQLMIDIFKSFFS